MTVRVGMSAEFREHHADAVRLRVSLALLDIRNLAILIDIGPGIPLIDACFRIFNRSTALALRR